MNQEPEKVREDFKIAMEYLEATRPKENCINHCSMCGINPIKLHNLIKKVEQVAFDRGYEKAKDEFEDALKYDYDK